MTADPRTPLPPAGPGGEVDLARARSPEHLRTSQAGALTLGLRKGRFHRHARLHCLNLLLTYPEGCVANCAYCGISRNRLRHAAPSFIRVDWPAYPLELILERTLMDQTSQSPALHRICISMVTRPRAPEHTVTALRHIRAATSLPVSVLVAPTVTTQQDLAAFRKAGADKVGIAVDAATEPLFNALRGRAASGPSGPHRWDRYWTCLAEAVEVFGADNVGAHLICGLGETEQELSAAVARMRELGGQTHLFSFYPEAGTTMESHPTPELASYRRIQLARYLIDNDLTRLERIRFDHQGRILRFGVDWATLDRTIDSGEPFRTSGCAGPDGQPVCNRPYSNSPPGPDIRNFPFPPWPEDLKRIRDTLGLRPRLVSRKATELASSPTLG